MSMIPLLIVYTLGWVEFQLFLKIGSKPMTKVANTLEYHNLNFFFIKVNIFPERNRSIVNNFDCKFTILHRGPFFLKDLTKIRFRPL